MATTTKKKLKKKSAPSTTVGERLIALAKKHYDRIPPEAWEGIPRDRAKNFDHYLYGHPKAE